LHNILFRLMRNGLKSPKSRRILNENNLRYEQSGWKFAGDNDILT